MRMTEAGTFSVSTPLPELINRVTDPEFLGRTLPDSKGYDVTGADSCVVRMSVGVSHIRGTMPTTLTIRPYVPGEPLVIAVSASGLGSRVDMTLAFSFRESGEGESRVDVSWQSDATISGVLASVGAGLLRPLAKRNFDAMVAAIQSAIEKAHTGS